MAKKNKIIKKTEQQEDVLNAIGVHSTIVINALAGTGKTTTLKMIAKENKNKSILYLVFGKGNEKEAKESFSDNTEVRTTHALALKILRQITNFDFNRLRQQYRAIEIKELFGWSIEDSFNTLKQFEIFCNSSDLKVNTSTEYGEKVKHIFTKMMNNEMDITHSFYLKYFHLLLANKPNLIKTGYDIALLDEAQDTNLVTLDIFNRLPIKTKVFVGDENQKIFSFRGSFNIMKELQDPYTIDLTQTFRCDKEVIKTPNKILKKFTNSNLELKSKVRVSKKYKNEAIISRTNSKLIAEMDKLIRDEKKFKTIRPPNQIFKLSEELFYLKTENKKEITENKFLKKFKDFEEAEDYAKETSDKEMMSAIGIVKTFQGNIFHIKQIANQYYYDERPNKKYNIFLTTAHTSKGLEWDKVTLLNDFTTFSELIAKSGYTSIENFRKNLNKITEDIIDEINLLYVATTRAKHVLEIQEELERELNLNQKDMNKEIKIKIKEITENIEKGKNLFSTK